LERQPAGTPSGDADAVGGCLPSPTFAVKALKTIQWAGIAGISGIALFLVLMQPRSRSLPLGYTYTYFPVGGQRYIVAPGGIKKVGQEVLEYHLNGTSVTGTVRLQLGHGDIRSFHLDLKTHEVTLAERARHDAL
jgi:hypothetical protein